jgi:hypothetical protein
VADVSTPGPLSGVAQAHAEAMLAVALTTLERLEDLGWRAVVGESPRATGGGGLRESPRRAIGGEAVAERTETFDPMAAIDTDPGLG